MPKFNILSAIKYAPKPRRKPREIEHHTQVMCINWFRLQYPTLRHRLFAVPNGSARDVVTGAKLKAEGVLAGVSDLILLKRNKTFGALLIEMKSDNGRQSQAQKEWEAKVTADNEYKYVVCRSLQDFIREINDYLNNN